MMHCNFLVNQHEDYAPLIWLIAILHITLCIYVIYYSNIMFIRNLKGPVIVTRCLYQVVPVSTSGFQLPSFTSRSCHALGWTACSVYTHFTRCSTLSQVALHCAMFCHVASRLLAVHGDMGLEQIFTTLTTVSSYFLSHCCQPLMTAQKTTREMTGPSALVHTRHFSL